jgi:hypothetical protein
VYAQRNLVLNPLPMGGRWWWWWCGGGGGGGGGGGNILIGAQLLFLNKVHGYIWFRYHADAVQVSTGPPDHFILTASMGHASLCTHSCDSLSAGVIACGSTEARLCA